MATATQLLMPLVGQPAQQRAGKFRRVGFTACSRSPRWELYVNDSLGALIFFVLHWHSSTARPLVTDNCWSEQMLLVGPSVFPAMRGGTPMVSRLKQQLKADSASILAGCGSNFDKRLADGRLQLEPRTEELVRVLEGWEERQGASKLLLGMQKQEQSQPVNAYAFRELFERDGLAVRRRDSLCKALEAYARESKSPSPETRIRHDAEVELCYNLIFEASECAHSLPDSDPRHVTSWQRRMLAGQAGLKIKSLGTHSEQSLRTAVLAMSGGVCGKACSENEVHDVRLVYFDLLSAMKMLNATHEELEEVVAEARLLDGSAANWSDAYAIHVQLPNIQHASFWSPTAFPWLEEVQARYTDIRDELDDYLKLTGTGPFATQPASARLESAPQQWNSLVLTSKQGQLCSQHFPITCGAVGFDRRPALQKTNFEWPADTPRGYRRMAPPGLQVHIYQLMPGGRVLPHRGVFCRLVGALGLRIPATGAPLTVGGETRFFREGEFIVFDDSTEHDVVNPSTNESRYVLTIMMLHPQCCRGCNDEA